LQQKKNGATASREGRETEETEERQRETFPNAKRTTALRASPGSERKREREREKEGKR